MSIQKTIGGDRLGSGKKMKAELHNYERSTHDLSYLWRSTMSTGTLVPFMSQVALPGDTFDIDLDAVVMTHPTVGPLFGSFKVQLDVFQAPIRLYNALLHNNALNIGLDMAKVKLPVIKLDAPNPDWNTVTDIDNAQINPSCLLSYLGIRGVGVNNTGTLKTREFNAVPILAYFDIYKNYYANKQETNGQMILPNIPALPTVNSVGLDGAPFAEWPSETAVYVSANDQIQINYTGTAPDLSTIYLRSDAFESPISDLIKWSDDQGGIVVCTLRDELTPVTIRWWRYRNASDIPPVTPTVYSFPLSQIDEAREKILSTISTTAPFEISTIGDPYNKLNAKENNTYYRQTSQAGLCLKTYQSDLFNNWIQTEWIDGTNGISEVTAISTVGNQFTLDTLNLAKKVYDMLNRIAVSGGTYDDWLDAVYAHDRYVRAETPMYMGGLIKELVFTQVVSTAQSQDQPLATLAGKGAMAQKHKGGKIVIKVDEPSYIIGIVSLTPRIDYSQGNSWDINLKTLNDLHKPALDEIGFQDLITEQMAWFDTFWDEVTNRWVQRSAGKQPAWINYMTNVNQTRGNFAIRDNEMFMTLNRRYEPDYTGTAPSGLKDLTTYIDPTKYNFIFAETSLDAQNFWTQISCDITARRKMSAKIMPNL